MRIIFMGTPDFAVPSLERLQGDGYDICAVFCQPDKPKGRGHKLQPPPVKTAADKLGLPIYQPSSLKDEEVQLQIENLKPDCIVVVAYGKILPKAVLDMPKYGCINVHGSLLPKYRGAAPIQWAVINGEEKTGITTQYMAQGVDTGDILLQDETEILQDETAGELFERLKIIGAETLIKTLNAVKKGELVRKPQNEELTSHAPMLKKQDGIIPWNLPAKKVYDFIRGMNPWPCAYTSYMDKKVKIYKSMIVPGKGKPGQLENKDGELIVYCKDKALRILELQPENGKRMDGHSFLMGRNLNEGAEFL